MLEDIAAVWREWATSAWAWGVGTPWGAYLTADPTGRRIALGVALGVLLVGAWLTLRFGRAVVKKLRRLPALLLVTLGGYYAAVLALRLDASQWAPAAAVAGATLGVVAVLGLVARRSGRGQSQKTSKSSNARKGRLATA